MTDALLKAIASQALYVVPGIDEGYVPAENYRETEDLAEATVVTSRVKGKPDTHRVVLDIDHEAKLVPSSTPGHYHLYIDVETTWERYVAVLKALAEAEVIEPGYYGASEWRGFTAARLPWVRKLPPKPKAALPEPEPITPDVFTW